MKKHKMARLYIKVVLAFVFVASCKQNEGKEKIVQSVERDSTVINREYTLEASMLGYFAPDGTRNPILKANKGDRVRITIINMENMTHDISMENLGITSKTLNEVGESASITFWADSDDTYFCTVPGHRAAGMVGEFKIVDGNFSTSVIAGIVPFKNGKPINVGFERGNLSDWKGQGDAFKNPLFTRADSIHKLNTKIGFDGDYFVSSGGTKDSEKTGILTSIPFTVIHPFASFKVSGGAMEETRVELVSKDDDKVIFKTTGQGRTNMQPVVVDLTEYLDREIFIRIIDNETGLSPIPYIGPDELAHISFDDFLFYPVRPQFDNELKQEDIIVMPPLDPIINAGLSGKEAAKAMTLPAGFEITLAAAEPDVVRPISFTIDARGRLWVVEGHTYPVPAEEGKGRDRILIFEDTNGDGTLDKRKVFMEGLNMASGIEVGMGGVWLGAAPYLMFIPTDFENDEPKGEPEILLDGWGLDDTHEVLNNLRWGPDGWLYGVHGVFTHSKVGKPGTPEDERTKVNAAVWRYHPTRHEFEVFSHGTSNPWGIDFNDYGHPFITVCVIPHMYHVIQGARYERQGGEHFNPYTYDDIKTIADHRHYLGDRGPHAGNFRSAAAGGGHAHAGAMIYLGGDTWPKEYRNTIFMNNINGAIMNNDQLTREGSGYVASHRKDFIIMNDSWSQWLNFKYDASGSVYVIDWYDQNQCHSPNPDVHDKTLGRIFKISHNNDKWVQEDLYKASDMELVNYQLHGNDWYVRQARTILQERGGNPEIHTALKKIIDENPDITKRLRALWTLHVTNGLDENYVNELLGDQDEYMRSWTVQLAMEDKKVLDETLQVFVDMAKQDESPLVRLYLASAMQRMEESKRWEILGALLQREEDVDDHNLPLMLWYAAEPMTELDAERMLDLAEKSKFSTILEYTLRKIASDKSVTSKSILTKFKNKNSEKAIAHSSMIDSLLTE
ncbi:PVC-type heme-binding CxxCH protein [Maribacter cobaltidurans]|uniref:Dehydrogenase n=1 Tax=Maribacter cobaltidurans TaxID=1178778 RepID=A0A223V2N0_9FLAO|nr:PVC-type heme-binding CxxCH protein [Maribacter cobaltidurans]ASV29109.1 dehydrogenase [Maribacter cobaltidurans]GGD71826.1 hypothetical protein GCM10011412_06800 [Maribacter cobaltidurans]